MKQELSETNTVSDRDFDLGTWLGRRQAFGMMAGRASAADVECLRTIRDRRLYKAKVQRWRDFCSQYVGASKPQVDRLIRYLEEFGPSYFELTSATRISPETYRLIAPHVSAEGVQFDGNTIPLTQERSAQLAAAVAELRRRAESARPAELPEPVEPPAPRAGECVHSFQYAMASVNLEEVIENVKALKNLRSDEREEIAELMRELDRQVLRLRVRW